MKRITTLTGPSCAGKSTLETMLAQRGALKAVSTTTRAPRPGERAGVDYYFQDKQQFLEALEAGKFIEHVQFGEHYYAMSAAEIDRLFKLGDHVVIVCEPNGMNQIRAWCARQEGIELRRVFVDNPQQVINERFLRRAAGAIFKAAQNHSDADFNAALSTYAKRMEIMMRLENLWRMDAHTYDVELLSFNSLNADTIADQLMHPVALTM